jgi:GTP pyrophosphokinase
MKTEAFAGAAPSAPIVQLMGESGEVEDARLLRARAFAEPLLTDQLLDTGEDALVHADGVAAILQAIGAAPSMRAAAYLVYAGDYLSKPEEVVTKAFGASNASLVMHTRKLVQIQRAARDAKVGVEHKAQQTERVCKMLLAFSRDRARLRWRESRCRCLRRWPIGLEFGKSSGKLKTWRFGFLSRKNTKPSQVCSTKNASSASWTWLSFEVSLNRI